MATVWTPTPLRSCVVLILGLSSTCALFPAQAEQAAAPINPQRARTGASRFGIWTYGRPFDSDMRGRSMYVDDDTLGILAEAGAYLVYGLKQKNIGDALAEKLRRFKAHGIEVHVSVTPMAEEVAFVNVWSFEALRGEIDQVLAFLESSDLLGDPVTTLVYDMEPMPGKILPFYGKDRAVIHKLGEYRAVQRTFVEFNRHLREEYGIAVRICADALYALDPADGDDDLRCLFGLLADEQASMSYMTYRRGDFNRDFILDHCVFLEGGDTIILNAWKEKDHDCWGDLACAIDDARLVLSYEEQDFGLEIWALWYFLKSCGIGGLRDFAEAITTDASEWPPVKVRGHALRTVKWRYLRAGVSVLDFYGPFFRIAYSAY